MKNHKAISPALNGVLTSQLTLINQYFLHSKMLKNWELSALAQVIYKASISEMKQSDLLIERIFFLEGLPNFQKIDKLMIGENVEEILHYDLQATCRGIDVLVSAIQAFEKRKDYVSRDLCESFLAKRQEYEDWMESQLWQIEKMGYENYLQSVRS